MTEVEHAFNGRLKGIQEPGAPTFIEVPRTVMRWLRWGRRVRVVATLNGHSCSATILNVGFGPAFIVSARDRAAAGIALNDCISVVVREVQLT